MKKGIILMVFCFFLSLLMCACSPSPLKGRIPGRLHVMEANYHNSRGMYSRAISSYMKALDYEEAAPYAEYGLGSVYLALGEEQAALNRFAEAKTLLEAFPAAVSGELRYRINYNTGVVLFSEGNFSAAADSFRDALRADSGKLEAKRNLELSIRSFTRENRFIGGDGGESESESKTALFEYVRQKELNHWKSREWPQEEDTQGLDY